jgi:alcohol dehydrogenase YqhD (iron-dependent ADH family)
VNQVLAVFNDVTNVVSGSDYLTSNLFLPEVWRMKEILAVKTAGRNEYIKSMTTKMSEKFDKYWGEYNILMSVAAVLDPRYKIKLTSFCFPIIYLFDATGDCISGVLDILKALYEVYVVAHNSSIIQQQATEVDASTSIASVTEVVPKVSVDRSRVRQHIRSNDIIWPINTDLDIYLEEDVFIFDSENDEDIDANFNTLGL